MKMVRHFAVIEDLEYATEHLRYCIEQVQTAESHPKSKPSKCGRFAHWSPKTRIISDVIEIELEFTPSTTEEEIEWLEKEVRTKRAESLEQLEKAIDPLKARLTELLAITYQPTEAGE